MNRIALNGRRRPKSSYNHRPQLEVLEERRLLTMNNLIVATYDDTHGLSVLRYNQSTLTPVPGNVATADPNQGNLSTLQGLAVAPDGSFYVSNQGGFAVNHFSNAGLYLGTLGAGSVFAPAHMEFGPNGHLYIADWASNGIFEFDTSSPNTPVGFLPLGYLPAGFTFADDMTHDLVVGALQNQTIIRYHNGAPVATLLTPDKGINPSAILPKTGSPGEYYVADFDLGFDPTNHHRVVELNTDGSVDTIVNLTTPLGTGMFAGLPAQPASMIYDESGDLLIGVSPDHNLNGAIQHFDLGTSTLTTLQTNIGTPSALGFIPQMRSDILVSTYEPSAGKSVSRFDPSTLALVPGSVNTNDPGQGSLTAPQGVAVAPDGTFYVTNATTGAVAHYDKDGGFLGNLGVGTIFFAASLSFGPNGHLFIGDWASQGIFEYDTASPGAPVGFTSLGYLPAGFTWVPASPTPDLVVGGLQNQTLTRYHSSGAPATVLISSASHINPAVLLRRDDGTLLVGDFDLGAEPFGHHQVFEMDPGVPNSQTLLVNLTTPVGTGGSAGWAPQPTSMNFDRDGNLLIGVSPDHNNNGTIQKYDFTSTALTVLKSGLGVPTGIGLMPAESTVTARNLFYKNSLRYDTTGNAQTPLAYSHDNAIATDKSAYIPGTGTAGFGNYSSYSKGINGVMVDLLGNGLHGSITLANILNDFTFKVGNNASPGSWVNAPLPIAVNVRPNMTPAANGASTVNDSDRIEILWADGAIQQQWLEVIVKSTANTGLAEDDHFFFGSAIGNTAVFNTPSVARTGASDVSGAQTHGASLANNIPISNIYDFDRDGKVNANDVTQAQTHGTSALTGLKLINIPESGPFAPISIPSLPAAAAALALPNDLGIAKVLAAIQSLPVSSLPVVASWITHRLEQLDWNHGPVARYFTHLSHENTAHARALLSQADEIAAALGIDDALLDSLLDKLGSE